MLSTVLVTGGGGGVGFELSTQLASLPQVTNVLIFDVVAPGVVERKLKAKCAREVCLKIKVRRVDLSDSRSIKEECDKLVEEGYAIDALIHNAAINKSRSSLSVDGYNPVWAVNVIGVEVLTRRLERILTPTARIIFVSSALLYFADADANIEMDMKRPYHSSPHWSRYHYNQSKLTLQLLCRHWGEHFLTANKNVLCACMTPGAIIPTNQHWYMEYVPGFLRVLYMRFYMYFGMNLSFFAPITMPAEAAGNILRILQLTTNDFKQLRNKFWSKELGVKDEHPMMKDHHRYTRWLNAVKEAADSLS